MNYSLENIGWNGSEWLERKATTLAAVAAAVACLVEPILATEGLVMQLAFFVLLAVVFYLPVRMLAHLFGLVMAVGESVAIVAGAIFDSLKPQKRITPFNNPHRRLP